MKTSLSLLGLIAGLTSVVAACDGGTSTTGPVPVTGGGTSTGGVVGVTGGATATGGSGAGVGTGGSGAGVGTGGVGGGSGGAASNLIFDGTGTWIPLEGNAVEIQGAFFILEDSVKNDVAVPPEEPVALIHSDLDPMTGGSDVENFSKFDELTEKPCVTGTIAMVTDEAGMESCDAAGPETEAGACQWSAQWGGGIGLNLNETGEVDGMASVKSPYDAQGHNITGFTFTPSGDGGGATLRFKAKNPGSDEDFCAEFTIVPGVAVSIPLSMLVHQCWGTTGTLSLDQTQIESLQWQIVSSDKEAFTVPSFCIENLSWY